MKEIRRKIALPSLCPGRKASRRTRENVLECLYRRSGKNEAMEAWPTSPVLIEETNTRAKEKAHRHYERQLKASSWYSKAPQPSWIEIAQPFDNGDSCSQCCYEEPCGCVIVSNQPAVSEGSSGQRRRTVGSIRSSLGDGSQCVESRTSTTEDERSFYDNFCDFCKVTTLERRARKYGEWKRRWSTKVVEMREDEPSKMCTCAMDHLSFIEWKQLYEQDELVTFSNVDYYDQAELISTYSNYDRHKSKDSELTVACREYPGISCLTVKTASLGYNSSCSIPNTEQELDSDSSYPPTVVSDSEGSSCNEGDARWMSHTTENTLTSQRSTRTSRRSTRTPHVFHGFRGNGARSSDDDDDPLSDKSSWIHQKDNALEQMVKSKQRRTKNKTSNSGGKKMRMRRTRRGHETRLEAIPPEETSTSSDHLRNETTTSSDHNTTTSSDNRRNETTTSSDLIRNEMTTSSDRLRNETTTSNSEASTLCYDDKTTSLEDDGIPTTSVTQTDISSKIPTQNDETLPADLLSEFLLIAKNIDEFYESIHAKKFLENRVVSTKCDSVEDTSEKTTETYSEELQKRIRSLERLCSFVDQSDEEASSRGVSPHDCKLLSSIDKEEQPVWRLSQQSLDLVHSRRSRSPSSGSSSDRSRCSTNGSRSSNSRCSTRHSDHGNGKLSGTSTENMRSPDSGFSEKASLLSGSDSSDACIGAKWAGSMQWDYTDWYFIGYDCNGEKSEGKEQNLTTIHEAPQAAPQDPLDWDW